MSSLGNILSQLYRVVELARSTEVEKPSSYTVLKLDLKNVHGKPCLYAVDAGVGRVQIGGSIVDVVQVVVVGSGLIYSRCFVHRVSLREDIQEAVQRVRRDELRTLLELSLEQDCIVLIDGSLRKALTDPLAVEMLRNITSRRVHVVAVSKQGNAMLLGELQNSVDGVTAILKRTEEVLPGVELAEVVLVLGRVAGPYLEVYTRCVDKVREVCTHVARACVNTVCFGYPLLLYLADVLSRVSVQMLRSFRQILERLSTRESDILLDFPPRAIRIRG